MQIKAGRKSTMKNKRTIALLNDSFPPTIDGVANVMLNYAKNIQKYHAKAVVVTPRYPDVEDNYEFEVLRYTSANVGQRIGYRAGYPFDPVAITKLESREIDLIHTHCPFVSTVLARVLRYYTGAPIVFTYHTKFDYDIERRIAINPIRKASVKFLIDNIRACDEVWVVSSGAGENLRSLGYTGSYIVMENGTDFAKGRASEELIKQISSTHNLTDDKPTFLFVGRMMWYKGIKLMLDGLATAKAEGRKFQAIFVGDGMDREEIMAYAADLGLEECIFPGAIKDRELLRGYFSRADLFMFTNNYDTNGIVVKEAAACDCPGLLLAGSCASEGIVHGKNGLLIEEDPQQFAKCIGVAWDDPQKLRDMGQDAAESIYLSWEDAVAKAYERYEQVLIDYEGAKPRHLLPAGQMMFKGIRDVRMTVRAAEYRVKRVRRHYKLASRRLRKNYRNTEQTILKYLRDGREDE